MTGEVNIKLNYSKFIELYRHDREKLESIRFKIDLFPIPEELLPEEWRKFQGVRSIYCGEVVTNQHLYHLIHGENGIPTCPKEINISNSMIDDDGLKYLNPNEIHEIKLGGKITDQGLASLVGIPDVEIDECSNITVKGMKYLNKAINIILWGIKSFTGDYLRHLSNAQSLEIFFSGDLIDDDLIYFSKIPKLCLSDSKITDKGLAHLSKVKFLNLCNCGKITDSGLAYLTSVEEINLEECRQITSQGLQYLKNAKVINVSDCHITNIGLASMNNLEEINLRGCRDITDDGIFLLTRPSSELPVISGEGLISPTLNTQKITCRTLKKIDIGYCPKITDQSLKYLTGTKEVRLRNCRKITDVGLSYLGEATYLELDECSLITDKGISCLTSVRHLSLEGCHNVTVEGIKALKNLTYIKADNQSPLKDHSFNESVQVDIMTHYIHSSPYEPKLYIFALCDDTPYHEGVEYWFRPNLSEIIGIAGDYWGLGCESYIKLITIGEKKSEVLLDVGGYYFDLQQKTGKEYPEFDDEVIEDIITKSGTECDDYDWPEEIDNTIYLCKDCDVFYLGNLKCKYCYEKTISCEDKVY